MGIRCQTLSLVLSLSSYLCPLFFIFSDLVNGLILLMNSNFSEPVNIVSIKWIVIVTCLRTRDGSICCYSPYYYGQTIKALIRVAKLLTQENRGLIHLYKFARQFCSVHKGKTQLFSDSRNEQFQN